MVAVCDLSAAVSAFRQLLADHHLPRGRVIGSLGKLCRRGGGGYPVLRLQLAVVPQIDCGNQVVSQTAGESDAGHTAKKRACGD